MQCTQRKAAIKTFGPKAAAKLKRARSSSQNIKKKQQQKMSRRATVKSDL